MTNKEMEALTNNIQQKLGQENAGLILDDLGKIITDNNQMNETINNKETELQNLRDNNSNLVTTNANMMINKDKEIERLKQTNASLLATNSSLLQQVSMGDDITNKNQEKEPEKKFSFKSAFNEKGEFI